MPGCADPPSEDCVILRPRPYEAHSAYAMQRPGFHLAWKKAQTRVKKEVKRVLFHVKTLDELSEAISKANQQDQTKMVVDSDICT